MEKFVMKLKPWQEPLAKYQTETLRNNRAFLSACHTGSGKTYLAAATIRDLKMPTLVVCPKVSVSQWKSVLEGMDAMKYTVGVVNPERLIASKTNGYYSPREGWNWERIGTPALLVFDEIHRGASGVDSKTTEAVARWITARTPANKVLAMSATPFDSPLKMRAIGYLMGLHNFTKPGFYRWCGNHGCRLIPRPTGRSFEFTKNRNEARAAMLSIRNAIGARFMSVGPDDIPDFPDEVLEVVRLDLNERDHAALERAYEEMPEKMGRVGSDERVKLMRLRQQAEFCKAEAMAEMAANLVEDGNSVFIMLNYTDARLRVEDKLKKLGIEYVSIYGGQKDSEREVSVTKFQSNEVPVLIGMASACGVALSLHDERKERPRVSLISPGYSSSEFRQGLGRIRRVGGTRAVQKIVIAANSVEERVGKALERKLENLDALTDNELERK